MGRFKATNVQAPLKIAFVMWMSYVNVQAQVESTTACYGVAGCNTFSLKCEQGHVIKFTSMRYGYKGNGRNGCCVYREEDCSEPFTGLHAYNVLKSCSGRQSCGPLQAPFNILKTCNMNISTYVHIEYECVRVTKSVNFCDKTSVRSAPEIHIQFDPDRHAFNEPTSCSCIVQSESGKVAVSYVDVRLVRPPSNMGTSCSSATLSSLPRDDVGSLSCHGNTQAESSTLFHVVVFPDTSLTKYSLSHLYGTGPLDEPDYVWLSLTDVAGGDVSVQCLNEDQPMTSLAPDTTINVPGSTSVAPPAVSESNDSDSSNSGAIVAGVLVPIIVLGIIGGVLFFLWRRKRQGRQKGGSARPNDYVMDNELDLYDEIPANYSPDRQNTSVNRTYGNNYDSENVSSTTNDNSEALKRMPTYQNVKMGPELKSAPQKRQDLQQTSRSPGRMIKDQTDRIIAFFRKSRTGDADLQPPQQRGRENSGVSYDHINAASPNVNKDPPTGQSHIYSHTKAVDDGPEPSAVQVGDAYIEFKFDVADDDLVVNNKGNKAEKKLTVPTRPPPVPSTSTRPSPNVNRLSPVHLKAQDSLNYDYASDSPRGSISDISEHSYKVLEKQTNTNTDLPLYDYADVNDKEADDVITDNADDRGSVYEDVQFEDKRISRQGTLSSEDGYLAPSVTMRAHSNPEVSNSGNKTKHSGNKQIFDIKNELANKKLKPVKGNKNNSGTSSSSQC